MARLSTEQRQEQIAQSVLSIIAEGGLEALSMPTLAARLNIVPSALYRHFANKEEMIIAALNLLKNRFRGFIREISSDSDDSLSAMQTLYETYRQIRPTALVIPRVLFSHTDDVTQAGRKQAIRGLVDSVVGDFSEVLRKGIREGQLRNDLDPESAALHFWGILVSTTLRWHMTGGEFDEETYTKQAWDMFRRAVSSDKPHRSKVRVKKSGSR